MGKRLITTRNIKTQPQNSSCTYVFQLGRIELIDDVKNYRDTGYTDYDIEYVQTY